MKIALDPAQREQSREAEKSLRQLEADFARASNAVNRSVAHRKFPFWAGKLLDVTFWIVAGVIVGCTIWSVFGDLLF